MCQKVGKFIKFLQSDISQEKTECPSNTSSPPPPIGIFLTILCMGEIQASNLGVDPKLFIEIIYLINSKSEYIGENHNAFADNFWTQKDVQLLKKKLCSMDSVNFAKNSAQLLKLGFVTLFIYQHRTFESLIQCNKSLERIIIVPGFPFYRHKL